MKWNIVADSSCDLLPEITNDGIGLSIVPLTINVGDKQYIDDENMNIKELLEEMDKEKKELGTACPSPQTFLEEFKKSDFAICTTITSGLSGTYNSAKIAEQMLTDEFPEKKVLVIDSKATGGKLVMIIDKARELIREGKTFEEISEILPQYAEDITLVFAIGSYDNLIKTGRMSKTAGLVATTLNIRAVARATDEGLIEVFKKPRGEKNAVKLMVEYAKENKKIKDSVVVITHCDNLEGALYLKEKVIEKLNPEVIKIVECRGLTTFYTMKNGLLLGF